MLTAILLGGGFLFLVGAFAVHVYGAARADGLLPLPKISKPVPASGAKRVPVKVRAGQARKQAVRAQRTASVVVAEAITTNWLARREQKRKQAEANPKPPRSPLLRRLAVTSGGLPGAPVPAKPGQPAPAKPATSPNGHRPPAASAPATSGGLPAAGNSGIRGNTAPPASTPPGGQTMTTPANGTGGAASDFMSATTRIIAEAEAGGIQSKARGGLVMGEGLKQLGAAMEQHARHLQDSGQYPAYVWEPWRQAATLAHAAASKVTEGGNATAELARRPMGEANGQAPHRDELNKK